MFLRVMKTTTLRFLGFIIKLEIFIKTKKSDLCDESETEEQIGADLYSKIIERKGKCFLDQNKRNFDAMCFDLNEILVGQKLFLRVYELKDKFRYLFHEDYKKK